MEAESRGRRREEKVAVVQKDGCRPSRSLRDGEGEHGEGSASYRGLGLRHAMAGLPKQFRAGLRAASLRFQRAMYCVGTSEKQ